MEIVMFFRNELNLALKKISELETEINNLKKDTVSRKELSFLRQKKLLKNFLKTRLMQ